MKNMEWFCKYMENLLFSQNCEDEKFSFHLATQTIPLMGCAMDISASGTA